MSLLSMCQSVADQVGLPRPSSIVGSSDQLARQMLALANEELEELAKKDWPCLVEIGTIATVASTQSYSVPSDFERIIRDTLYQSDQYYHIMGALSASEWQYREKALQTSASRTRLRIFGSPLKIYLTPTPDSVDNLAYEYITSNLAYSDADAAKALYALDTDYSRVPERVVRAGLKWRIKHAKGLDYHEDYNDAMRIVQQEFAQQLAFGSMPVAVRTLNDDFPLTEGFIPENGYG